MPSLGILILNYNQEYKYFKEVAGRASNKNITIHLFSPADINPETEKVHGKTFDPDINDWKTDIFAIPDYIYDRCFYNSESKKRLLPIVKWLKSRPATTFLGYGLPNKWEVYNSLQKYNTLIYYLHDTQIADSAEQIIGELKKQGKLLIKPASGSQGRGVIALHFDKKGVSIKTQHKRQLIEKLLKSERDFLAWLKTLLHHQSYLIQPLLALTNKDKQPFDLRILLQRNNGGSWVESGRGVRIGQKRGIISNLNGGGVVQPYEDWLKTHNRKQQILIEDEISTLLEEIPKALEAEFDPLFEIGIDIGIDRDGALWILDINSKPGHQVVLKSHPEKNERIYNAPLNYCLYLDRQLSLRS
jgi:glutathione synthase/RimK-type ligase-like ATP-grasp enzyme